MAPGPLYLIDEMTGCWVWQRTKRRAYGVIYHVHPDGRKSYLMAHRVFYEQQIGRIPEGLTLDHLCCNPPCVNPAHMEPVTIRENNRRKNTDTVLRLEHMAELRKLFAQHTDDEIVMKLFRTRRSV